MQWVKRSLWILAGILLVMAVCVAAAVVWFDSRTGRAWLAAAINEAAGGTVRVTEIGGRLPFHPAVEDIELADAAGRWASLRAVRLDFAPLDLLRRRVTIQHLAAGSIEVERLPQAQEAEPAKPSPSSAPPGLPQLPVEIDIRHLSVGSLSLPREVLGEPTRWTVHAAAHLIGRDLGLDLQLAEVGTAPLRFEAHLDLADARVGAQARLDDPRGLLLRRAMGEALPLRVRLADDPNMPKKPADWHGQLTATVGDSTRLEAGLHLAAVADSHRFETHGVFKGGDLLSPALAPLVGDAVNFHIAAGETAGERVTLEALELQAAAFEASGAGAYLTGENRIETSLRIALPDLAQFSDLAGQPLAGAAILAVAANGPLDMLQAEADMDAAGLGVGPMAADHAQAKLQAQIAPGQGYEVKGQGRLEKIRADNAALPAGLGELVEWQLGAQSDATGERVALRNFDVSAAGVNLAAQASLDRGTEDVNGTLRLQLGELRRYAELAVPGLAGRGQVTADLAGKMHGPMTVQIDGGFDDLVTGIPVADALIGKRLRIEATVQRDASGRVEIGTASLAAAAARLTAQGALDPAADRLDGTVAASVEDLAVLRRAGLQTKGRLRLDAEISGSPSAPAVDARLAGSGFAWQAVQIDRIAAHLQARTEGTPAGDLTANLQSRDLMLRLDGQATLSPDRKILDVTRLRLRSPHARLVEARLRTALDTFLTSGRISANISDLTPWSSLAGMDIGGRLNLNLALSTRNGGQAADLAFAAGDLQVAAGAEPITVRRLSAKGSLRDLLRRPAGQVEAKGDHIAAAGAHLDNLGITVRSSEPNHFAFNGTAAGDLKGRFNLSTAGNVVLDRGVTRLTLARLAGSLAGTPLQLQRPLLVTMSGADLGLDDLALAVGDGRIEGMLKRDTKRLDMDVTARQLPVGLGAALAGQPGIGGTVDLRLALAGPAAQPRGRLTLGARDLHAGPAQQGQPALAIDAVADIAPSEVNVEAAMTAGDNRLLSANGAVPVAFGPAPGIVALAKHRPLRLRVRGGGELAQLADFLPLAGDRLAGAFRLAFDADGPVAHPQLTGELTLDGGHYENHASGFVVDALALQVAADRDRVVLRRLAATDGDKGKLEGSGAILLNGGQAPAADATVNVAGFRALRRSDATLSATGTATVKGPLDAPTLLAQITVDEAEFFIPDPPPASAKKIPVTVIDSATGRVLEQPKEPASTGKGGLGLDVSIHVPGRTFIRGRGLDSEWGGDIHVQGNSAAPELTGALKVVKGKFAFFGKDLALTRGTVTFTGGAKIEPDLDVLAETENGGTTFQVGASGTPDDLKIKLSSTPPLPEDEILSRLIFGREMTRLTPTQGLQLAQAVASLSSGGPGMLDKMRQGLGLDTLNIGSGSDGDNDLRPSTRGDTAGGNGGTEDTGVSAGKYIADGVYVGAEQRLSGETRSKVEVEVLPDVSVETTAGNRGESVGIIWRKDY